MFREPKTMILTKDQYLQEYLKYMKEHSDWMYQKAVHQSFRKKDDKTSKDEWVFNERLFNRVVEIRTEWVNNLFSLFPNGLDTDDTEMMITALLNGIDLTLVVKAARGNNTSVEFYNRYSPVYEDKYASIKLLQEILNESHI